MRGCGWTRRSSGRRTCGKRGGTRCGGAAPCVCYARRTIRAPAPQPRVLELENQTARSMALLEELRLNVELLNVMYETVGKEVAK